MNGFGFEGSKFHPLKKKGFENIPKMFEIMNAVRILVLLNIASSQVSLSDNINFDCALALKLFYNLEDLSIILHGWYFVET